MAPATVCGAKPSIKPLFVRMGRRWKLFRESGDLPDKNKYHGVWVMHYALFPSFLDSNFPSITRLKILLILFFMMPAFAHAEETTEEDWNAKFQATYIYQYQPAFNAAYSGPNSLGPYASDGWTATVTGFLGWRLPWQTGEVYFNPEVVSVVPLDQNLVGLGGFQNGELQKGGGAAPKAYMARLFLRQTWGLGGDSQGAESDMNQLAGAIEKNRIVLTVGWISLLDIFDRNSYAADQRSQFLNFSTLTYTSYDYAADGRGYTFGLAAEWYQDNWAFRFGHMAVPTVPNGMELDYGNILQYFGEQVELEHDHELGGMQGKIRLLGYRNQAVLASWREAISVGIAAGTVPDITTSRTGIKIKYGFGLSLEQSITPSLGLFFRGMWSDGLSEEANFTEADQSLSVGASLTGVNWGRPKDTVGVAMSANYLSAVHADYLAMGGISSFLGDGGLNYEPEEIFEAYYNFNLAKKLWLAADYQHFINPGYNAARGPMDVFGIRMHAEY